MALQGVDATLKTKTADDEFQEINPKTSAAQVYMTDEQGGDSTVKAQIEALRVIVNQLTGNMGQFMGTVSSTEPLPTISYKAGWSYLVEEAGTYAGKVCEVGDFIVCIRTYASGSASNDDWRVIQKNLVGAVTGPSSSVAGNVAIFDGSSGTKIKDSGFTIAKSVPADALFSDTTYGDATEAAGGLMTASDKAKLNKIESNADVTDTTNVKAAGAFMKDSNTADDIKDGSSKVVMTAAERSKLSRIADGAEVNQNAFGSVTAGSTTFSASTKTDTMKIVGGSGITVEGNADTRTVTVSEQYVDVAFGQSVDNAPANLRIGGLFIEESSLEA